MHIYRHLRDLPRNQHHVITIGNFDGVHLGHRALIKTMLASAHELECASLAMIFEPQPMEVLQPTRAPARLMRLAEKCRVLKTLGVERVLAYRFDHTVAAMAADEFAEDVLVNGLKAKHIIVGEDFRFGVQRQGDTTTLKELGAQHGFTVTVMADHRADGERVSSTHIREALQQGKLDHAAALLGRPYSLYGRVIHGDKRGRQIEVPTANIALKRNKPAIRGVFVVNTTIDGKTRYGVANVGTRPTVDGEKTLLEVHLFDFDGDLYGRYLEVTLLERLRDECKFPDFDSLVEQIRRDIAQAKDYISTLSYSS